MGRGGDFVRGSADEAVLFWEDAAAFHVRHGREIIVEPCAGADERLIRAFLLGSALGVLLHQRGLLTLHASAVEIQGGAVAFVGWKGYGKSTTATALHTCGYRLLTDDTVALAMSGSDSPIVYPGFPQVKLWPDAAAALVEGAAELPQLHPDINKLVHRAGTGFSPAPLPLRAIFVLDQGAEPAVEPVPIQEAFFNLVSHSYALRFLKIAGATAQHFTQCDQLVRRVPVWRLRRPRSLEALPTVVRLIEEQLIQDLQPA
ncbi:MAG: serine kinase [Oscillochloris sp.]|nr:serine kinase [Oscillochloris sp.]